MRQVGPKPLPCRGGERGGGERLLVQKTLVFRLPHPNPSPEGEGL